MRKDYAYLEGKTFECGVTVVRLMRKDELESFGISPGARHTYALCDTHCAICGLKAIPVAKLVSGVRKFACSHASKKALASLLHDRAVEKREAKTADDLERAEHGTGLTWGIYTVESIVWKM